MLERQLKNAPPEQKEMIMTMMQNDPELMQKISKEIEAEMKKGKDQMAASMTVLPKYQAELQKAMGGKMPGGGGGGARFNPNGSIHR